MSELETAPIRDLSRAREIFTTQEEFGGQGKWIRLLKSLPVTDLRTGVGPSLSFPVEQAAALRMGIARFNRAKDTKVLGRRFTTELQTDERGQRIIRVWRVL